MANPTTNYGWVMPTSTDLVTDLPADFAVFGQAVDTSLADLKGGSTGQVLAKATNTDMDFTWVTTDDTNAIQNAIVDAKGDLIGATAADTPARLAVGTNGQVLTADSTAATGLAWATASTSATSLGYTAGKNKLINGDFSINQRSFTTTSTSGTYGFDRWVMQKGGTDGTCTYTPQTFTAGTAPVAGYEATNFARLVTAAGTATNVFAFLGQRIEDVRTYANQTITVSFWAKAATGTPKIAVDVEQYFGSGGSTQVNTPAGAVTISTSWARYSVTIAVPTISGTTIGAGNYTGILLWVSAGSTFNTRASSIGIQNGTFDVWGVQSEIGSTLTAFQTATGTLQGELAACQRYYWRQTGKSGNYSIVGNGFGNTSGTLMIVQIKNPVELRTEASSIDSSGLLGFNGNSLTAALTSVTLDYANQTYSNFKGTVTCDAKAPLALILDIGTTKYIGFSAEL
jgi:hypothetical protein